MNCSLWSSETAIHRLLTKSRRMKSPFSALVITRAGDEEESTPIVAANSDSVNTLTKNDEKDRSDTNTNIVTAKRYIPCFQVNIGRKRLLKQELLASTVFSNFRSIDIQWRPSNRELRQPQLSFCRYTRCKRSHFRQCLRRGRAELRQQDRLPSRLRHRRAPLERPKSRLPALGQCHVTNVGRSSMRIPRPLNRRKPRSHARHARQRRTRPDQPESL
jgi:hypothetical protein